IYKRACSGIGGRPHRERDLRPLYLAIQMAMARAANYCKPGARMDFVVDNNPQTNSRIAECYADFLADAEEGLGELPELRFNFGELSFADSREAVPLQAADLLAYEAHRWAKQSNPDARMRD